MNDMDKTADELFVLQTFLRMSSAWRMFLQTATVCLAV